MLSFIIPVFNEEENIGQLIDSINQGNQLSDYEIIVVDNGSTNNPYK